MPYTFDPINRTIGIPPGEIVTHMSNVYNEAMDWADSPEGISHPVPIRATGKIPLGASGAYTDVVYSLINNYKLKYMGGYGTPPWPTGLSINPGTLIESFNDINNWYIESGTGSLELDYTYFKGLQNKQSFRINCSPGAPLVVRNMFDTPTNFGWVSNYAFWVYIPELTNLDHIDFKLLMSVTGDRGFTWHLDPQYFRHGWNKIIISEDQFTSFGAALWTEDVYGWETHMVATSDTFFIMDEIYVNASAMPTFTFLFRDARLGLYYNKDSLTPVLAKSCAYVDVDQVGQAGFCNLSQLQELYEMGMEFYPTSHVQLLGMDEHLVHAELRRQQKFLEDNNFTRGVHIYKYSSEGYDSTLIEQVRNYYDYAITNTSGYNSYPWINFPYELKMFRLDASITPVEDLYVVIQNAISTGTNIIFGFRDIVSDQTVPNSADYTRNNIAALYLTINNKPSINGIPMIDGLKRISEIVGKQVIYQASILGTCVTDDGSSRTIQPDEGTVEITFEVSSAATIHAPIVNIDVPTANENAAAVWTHTTAYNFYNLLLSVWRFLFNRKTLTKMGENHYREEIFYDNGSTVMKTTNITKSGPVETRE